MISQKKHADRSRYESRPSLFAVRVSVLLMLATMGCVDEEIPAHLIGTWMATSPSHQGRFIEISDKHIIFSSDEIHSIFYAIHRVESIGMEDGFAYSIEYRGVGGGSRMLSLRYIDGDPVAIELENQAGNWIRKDQVTPNRKEAI